jgi:LacI family transcriptional regulator
MKDIARELGVSVVTVSKALRNHDDISEETRARVLQHSFFGEIAKGLTNVFRKKGYGLVMSTSEEDPELEQQEIEQLLARRVDALIVASTQVSVASFERIEEQNVPYVLIDRHLAGLDANFVGVDDQSVGQMATEHLIQCGCKRIAFMYGTGLSPAMGRLEGYRQALLKHGIEVRPEYIRAHDETGDATDDAAYATMKDLLRLPEPPDGVFGFNDQFAVNAMKAVLDAGKRIPEDVAFIGSGNIKHADFLRVPLTTIDQNSVAIGERAAKIALSIIESKTPVRPRTVLLEPRLVVRQSSMRIPR